MTRLQVAQGKAWTHDGSTLCFMDEAHMAEVGVTAGVKKVIAAVKSRGAGSVKRARGWA